MSLVPLDQPQPGNLTVKYAPDDGAALHENPPRFCWLPDIDGNARYVLRITPAADAPCAASELQYTDIAWNFFTPDTVLPPGHYSWSYALWSETERAPCSTWSTVRSFQISEDLTHTPALSHQQRYANASRAHPRLWLQSDEIAALGEAVLRDPQHCGWQQFMDKAVTPWLQREPVAEPAPYPNNKRVGKLWRLAYIDTQEALYGIRHLSIAGCVLKDASIIAHAKKWLLEVAAWDVRGTTSREYNDEASFRIAAALAWGYDWLWAQLSEDERRQVRAALLARLSEVAHHVIDHARIHLFPYDSHAIRAISSVMVPCAIALLDEEPQAQVWLDYAIDTYDTLYPAWGGSDGGWAEGPHYWTTAMAYFTEAANLIKKYLKHNLYKRPFFQRTAYFPLYVKAPGSRRTCFGDDSTLGDLPSLKVAYNVRQFAGITADPHLQWYFEEILRQDQGTENAFYNYGWWSFAFDDLQYAHDFPAITAQAPDTLARYRHFRDVGWVAIHKNLGDPEQHIHLITKCSPYGCISHSYADQSAFLLSAYGEDLAIQPGYYVGFGTSMHLNWRRQTKSKNAILIAGKGQYAGMDKGRQFQSSGQILGVTQNTEAIVIRMDPTAAYQMESPALRSYTREIHFVHDSYFVIVDSLDLEEEAPIQWLLHTNRAAQTGQSMFRYQGERAGLTGEFVFNMSGPVSVSTAEGFEGVAPHEYEGLPVQHQVIASTPSARHQRLVTLLVPYRLSAPERVFYFIDDQGFADNIYFQDSQNRTYTLSIPKVF